jgi:NAD(P)-dependent dehydrogenase (short-subunit alcohol dehydrogenase family)
MEIKGKAAVVTGAGSGIGRAIAHALADAGAAVMVADIEAGRAKAVADEIIAAGGKAASFSCDVRDSAAVAKLADAAWAALGPVSILCNNAGVTATSDGFDLSDADMRWQIDVNLVGVFNGMREFGSRFRAEGKPAWIVNTGSHNALGAPYQQICGYVATKHAVLGLSEAFRTDYPESNVGISILCPGVVNTGIWDAGRNRPSEYGGVYEGDPGNAKYLAEIGLSPARVGERVVDGIRKEDFYIFTHAEDIALIEKRYQEGRACMERQWPKPAA